MNKQNILRKKEKDGVLKKNWYNHPQLGKCLFKESRPSEAIILEAQTDWAEKVVTEIANLLNLPVAQYELADGYLSGSPHIVTGVISLNCIPIDTIEVFTGQQLLTQCIEYNPNNPSQYTIDNVLKSLDLAKVTIPGSWKQPIDGIDTGAKLFIGYMLLDTLVNNSDRHDHNWGVMSVGEHIELIPSFDHGLSLGSTDTHKNRLRIPLAEHVNSYSPSCFQQGYSKNPNLSVFDRAAQLYPDAAKIWQKQLAQIEISQFIEIFNRVPDNRITPTATKFAIELLTYNHNRILNLDIKSINRSIRNTIHK